MQPDFQLSTPEHLFGNDAAEDEPEDVFRSYAINRAKEIDGFLDQTRPLQVVRAYKGEGKSALLRLVEGRLKGQPAEPVIVRTTGQAISPSLDSSDSDKWVREWKRSIVGLVASEIGARISVAMGDDAITLVEEAERNGFKERSFVSAVTDRLTLKSSPIERQRPAAANLEPVVKRWLEQGSAVWLFIDDIDQNFRSDLQNMTKVAACFIAARQLFSQIPELRIRLAIRPNTWATIKPHFEALSHIEQYMIDLRWDATTFLDLLGYRIRGYLRRTDQFQKLAGTLSPQYMEQHEQLVGLVFDTPVAWAGRNRPVHVALHTLSRHRPRWLVELCKVSAKQAHRSGRQRINLQDIVSQLETFGQRRIEDTIAEFRPQCAQLEQLIVAFASQSERYSTDELIKTIRNRILQGTTVKIDGVIGQPGAREIGQFLFQVGFLTARRDDIDGSYQHFSFSERPNLLRATTNVDEGMSWEIHPVFRDYLRLKDVESKSELARRSRRRDRDI